MPTPSHTLMLVIGTSGSGGAERVLSTLANAWARRGWNVTVVTFETPDAIPFYPFHPAVNFRPLGEPYKPGMPGLAVYLLGLVRRLRAEFKRLQPDCIVSFIDRANVLTLLAALGLPFPVIVSEHTEPQLNLKSETSNWRVWEWLRKWTYRRAGRVVVLSPEARQGLPPAIQPQCVIIPNPVPVMKVRRQPVSPDDGLRVVSAGKLAPQKQFDLLIQAFSRIAAERPQWSLWIYGDGSDRQALEDLVSRLQLEERVHLPGRTQQLFTEFQKGQMFAVTSRYETFGMALAEAMACGLPAVSFDLPGGPRQIVRPEVDGLLVPPDDVAAFSAALARLMDDEALRRQLAARAPEVVERFGLHKILPQWDELFSQAAPGIFKDSEERR